VHHTANILTDIEIFHECFIDSDNNEVVVVVIVVLVVVMVVIVKDNTSHSLLKFVVNDTHTNMERERDKMNSRTVFFFLISCSILIHQCLHVRQSMRKIPFET
jgi:hypothetical protein